MNYCAAFMHLAVVLTFWLSLIIYEIFDYVMSYTVIFTDSEPTKKQ